MSNSFSAANVKSPGGDARLDLTDVYAFKAPHDPGQTVLIMDVDPFQTDSMFHPDAVYRFNIDTDGDAREDVSVRFLFSPPEGGRQTGTAYYAAGSHAGEAEPSEEVLLGVLPVSRDGATPALQSGTARMFAGVRSDPFFADAEGALHGFQWTGHDTFAGANVLTIAMQVPDDMLSPDPEIGVWATVSLWQNGKLTQMDRGGHPTINPFVNPDDEKDEYNARHPADDVNNYLGAWSELLQKMGGRSAGDARAAALQALPDILRFDRTKPASYPNGRALTDDVYSDRFAWLSNGRIGPDGLHPHGDTSSDFPYLGPPNANPTTSPAG
jgi:Domain of unknown function (DUF4331)